MKLAGQIVWWLLAAALTALFLWLIAVLAARLLPARAHGEWAWIEKEFTGCCGANDCFPITLVPETQGGQPGYRTQDGDWVPHAQTKPSRDPQGRHWRCYVMRAGALGAPVRTAPRDNCTFVSPGSF